ncbi:hypothetical protein [Aquimarina longa]|uniref:hypothetical protein n=1 Tax=Aquimarina longa TaxID=1080221 RepID=UPI0007819AC1|nr:hypothetical protein [Aquimarina longa]
MKNKQNESSSPEKSKAIGNTLLSYYRKDAKKQLLKAKSVEELKKNQGWIWLKKEKEHRLVHPNKVKSYLVQGYKEVLDHDKL